MKKNEWTSINTRLPSDVAGELTELCEITEKSAASLVTSAVEYYICEVKGREPKNSMQVDRFAWELFKKKGTQK
tara:strand:+ start:520 stop:741 length:222 start_codon:yes stop_codon:yes gene_type:complete